jgi:hypothetical protein
MAHGHGDPRLVFPQRTEQVISFVIHRFAPLSSRITQMISNVSNKTFVLPQDSRFLFVPFVIYLNAIQQWKYPNSQPVTINKKILTALSNIETGSFDMGISIRAPRSAIRNSRTIDSGVVLIVV